MITPVINYLKVHRDLAILFLFLLAFIGGGVWMWHKWQINDDPWQTNFDKHAVPLDDIVSSGTSRDAQIAAIDHPLIVAVEDAMWLNPRTPVIVVEWDETARAYPLTILLRHEIVNDQIGLMSIAVTFCPLCNSAIVYDRQVAGEILRMGVTGNLYHSGFLMWDDATQSWWQQFTGVAIVGDYIGTELDLVPAQVVGWSAFEERYPNGTVLVGDADNPNMDYTINPYMHYDSSQAPMMSKGNYDTRLLPMARVLAAEVDHVPVAYPFAVLERVGTINDEIQDTPIVAFWQPGAASALDGATIASSEDVGMAALFGRELDDGRVLTFRYEQGRIYDDQTNSEWNIFGEAIAGELRGTHLPDYYSFSHFWFAWSSAYPHTLLYTDS